MEESLGQREVAAVTALPDFPLVGMGASAGGLEAISELLSNLPANSGVALLVVQHLVPDHPSMLTEILARRSAMPVVEGADNQVIEKNHVYVIPPNTSMRVADGRLVLKSREAPPGIPMPVDDLFHSLAEEQGAGAIGIGATAPTVRLACRPSRVRAASPLPKTTHRPNSTVCRGPPSVWIVWITFCPRRKSPPSYCALVSAP